ncbi:hypothetical protein CHU98_g3973 [Xylaria longipes]|nr:hypothetical protein CHU98_g3973 [Xylaria longipes]
MGSWPYSAQQHRVFYDEQRRRYWKWCLFGFGVEAGTDTCPEYTILEPVSSWPDLDVAPVGRSGPCGYNARVSTDYNQPSTEHGWGIDLVATYTAGNTIDVVWCVDYSGDHSGMFTYRLCKDQALVDKF